MHAPYVTNPPFTPLNHSTNPCLASLTSLNVPPLQVCILPVVLPTPTLAFQIGRRA